MSQRASTRREFLKGRAAVDALADLLPEGAPPSAAPPGPANQTGDGSFLLQFTRRAMACEFAVYLTGGQPPHAPDAALRALDLVESLEDQMTVYREHSEVSAINRSAARDPLPVEPQLFRLLQLALELHDSTGGAFDITSGPLSKVWGFHRREGRIPSAQDLADALQRVGSRGVELSADNCSIRFAKEGVEINLGGIGKGYALDACAEQLLHEGVDDFLFHGGQSSVLARGSRVRASAEAGWLVGLRHPLRPDRRIAEIRLRDRALGTSGTGTQSFYHQGQRYGHILDPRTGRPARGVFSSTVVARSAAEADALATAFYVMGPDESMEYCRSRPGLAAVLVVPGSRSGTVKVYSAGLADEDWTCFD